jgi:hypothetical protein
MGRGAEGIQLEAPLAFKLRTEFGALPGQER